MECTTQQTPHLCEDIVIEILARLPAKSLVRSMAVCRLWKSIITHPQFSLDSKRPHKISVHTNRECYTFLEDENLLVFETDFPLKNNFYMKYWNDNAILMGSDNGLLCIGIRNPNVEGATYRVIIWNPCIRRHVLIPEHPIDGRVFELVHGFGGTISGSDYKYVRIVGFSVDVESYWMVYAFEVYSLKTRTWRPRKYLDYESYRCKGFESTGALLRGRLHFIVSEKRDGLYYSNSIASFELEDEVLEEDIMLPVCLSLSGLFDKFFLHLTLIKESLAVVANENMEPQIFSVWVMEEYGDVNSWINLCNIDLTMENMMENIERDPRNMVGLLKNGDLLLGFRSIERNKIPPKPVTYNLKTRKTSDFGVGVLSSSEFCGFANYYKESLVLLADDYHSAADHKVLSMSEQSLVMVCHPSWFLCPC